MSFKMKLEEIKSVLQSLPMSINGFYGDAMQPTQWNDTVSKLEELKRSGHSGDIMVPTKYIMTDEQIKILSNNFPDVWVFYAITGLEEKYLLADYEKSYSKLCEAIDKVVCVIRPIIPNKNDSFKVINPILEMVKRGNKLLTYTGYRDPNMIGSKKHQNTELFDEINSYCKTNDILSKEKCVCMVAAYNNSSCHIHDKSSIINADLIKALGYEITVVDDKLYLHNHKNSNQLSKGDIAFVNILTKSKPIASNFTQSEILSFDINGKKLVSSSSWFSWARQIPCIIGCDYCFADFKSNVRIELDEFGCNPIELLNIIL